ncbi:hypothetical protein BZA05DRAFT_435818 [Tricharina praecox]|uniref:uncharacterized protein n=1 Tax=Tricharina praecox TaxID=43433 RepID=UPI00221EC16C|nr:uncharacterized protein BZA05DRAFT_435818 [Tricharina praecox]KAI5853415.1 hypothetical protein BZA05DRAFT_435818 [Tricharina praecox]
MPTATSTPTTPVPTALFGGALHVLLPPGYLDASLIREVPSTQEVFVPQSTSTDTSIIFDILEPPLPIPAVGGDTDTDGSGGRGGDGSGDGGRDSDGGRDNEALKIHWDDIVSPRASRVVRVQAVDVPGAQMPGAQSQLREGRTRNRAWCICGTVGEGEGAEGEGYTAILATVVRLHNVATDLVVTVNVPVSAEEARAEGPGAVGETMARAFELRDLLLGSLEVRDWGLFVNE